MHARRTMGWSTLGLALVSLGAVVAGPLSPPSGPAASTYKTLADLEPRTAVQSLPGDATAQFLITQPGSYCLAGPITGVSGKMGIKVLASDVTIDLAGQTMDGNHAGTYAVEVDPAGSWKGITIRNGILSNWATIGVDTGSASGCHLDSLQVRGIGTGTALVAGQGSLVVNCVMTTSAAGLSASSDCLVVDCTSDANTYGGIQLSDGCSAVRCLVRGTSGAFDGGLVCGSGCTLIECDSGGNAAWGINAGLARDCTIARCRADSNSGGGIWMGSGGTIRGCQISEESPAGTGILVDQSGSLGDGQGATIVDNAVVSYTECVRVRSNCMLFRNSFFGTPALRAAGTGNRIDSNILTGGTSPGVSVVLEGSNNFLVRNHIQITPSQIGPGNRDAAVITSLEPVGPYPWGNFQQ